MNGQAQQSTETLLKELGEFILDAHDMCDRGEFISLESLQPRVKIICEHINQLPVEDALRYTKELEILSESLGGLEQQMRAQRDALGEELNDATRHQKAAKAYIQSEHSAPRTQDS